MITIALIVALVVMTYLYVSVRMNNYNICIDFDRVCEEFTIELDGQHKNFLALEQGSNELAESYEMRILSYEETIQRQNVGIQGILDDRLMLWKIYLIHETLCLPRLDVTDDLKVELDDLRIRMGVFQHADREVLKEVIKPTPRPTHG